MKAKIVLDGDGKFYGIRFDCPACGRPKALPVDWLPADYEQSPHAKTKWGFNGDLERPTLTPSVLQQWQWGEDRVMKVCHSFVRDGRIEYLGDCTHALAGQTVDLPDIATDE